MATPLALTTPRRFNHSSESKANPNRLRFLSVALLVGGAALALDQTSDCMGRDPSTESFAHAPRFQNLAIFSGTSNPKLAKDVAEALGVNLAVSKIKKFNDGEIGIRVGENVRGKDCYIIQPTCPPDVNDHVVELLLMVSTLRRASAGTITAVIPYYGYARQDRKMQSRVPISAADMARLLESMGVDRVVAVDLHCGQIQGFFSPSVPVDNLEGHIVGLKYFMGQNLDPENTKVVSPDAGGVYRAKQFREGLNSKGLNAGLAMIIKQRAQDTSITNMDLVGEVNGCDVIMVDDMIDTAGTLTKAAAELKTMGAKRVFAFATHGLFSGPAFDRIEKSCLEKVVVTNTIPLAEGAPGKIVQESVAELLAESIARIHLHKSVSSLFYHADS
jgi:ribose-phosphate pyrophosphokinase